MSTPDAINSSCPSCQGRGPKSVFDPHSEIRPTGQQLCLTSSTPFRDASLSWYGRIRGSNETTRVRGRSPNPHMNLPSSHYDEPLVAGGSSYEYVSHSLASGGRGSLVKTHLFQGLRSKNPDCERVHCGRSIRL